MKNAPAFKLILVISLLFQVNSVIAEEKISIGVQTALTGPASSYGTDLKNILMFANDELGGSKYKFIFEDDRCNGQDAVNAAHKLIDVEKVKYVLGFACSSTVLSTASLYEKAQVMVIASSASAPAISQAGDYIFRTWPGDQQSARVFYDYVADHHKLLGIVSEQTDYAQGFQGALLDRNKQVGKIKIYNENYLSSETDFRSLLLRLRANKVEGLFVNSQTELGFVAIFKQIKELKWDVPIYGAYWPNTKVVRDKVGQQANGIVFVDAPELQSLLTADGDKIYNKFLAKYGEPNSVAVLFVTALESFRALDQAVSSGQDLRQYLYSTKFNGIVGPWTFDQNGDLVGLNPVMKIIKDGKVSLASNSNL